jgi:transposase, IS5 family
MSKIPGGASRQAELFARSKRPTISIEENHRLVQLTDRLDWTEMEVRAETIRASKLKNGAGRPPHLRALLGAMVLRATRYMPYRVLADQIRHYGPARYLCGLSETDWSPDHNTLHNFIELMGEEGARFINEYTVEWAVNEKLADPSVVVGDTTVQEAAIPHPNEMGLMAAFMNTVAAASSRAGSALKEFVKKASKEFEEAKERVREYRLFAKSKTKAVKNRMVAQLAALVERVNVRLGKTLAETSASRARLSKYGVVASAKLARLHETMTKLVPQVRYWLRTGFVASNKVISLHLPELYSIVRGKVGKSVEFGLSWGVRRLRGGYLLATVATTKNELVDTKFAVSAVHEHIALFGKPPKAYAYDRGGWSEKNVAALKKMGVKAVGLAPQGKAAWQVSGATKKKLVSERAQIEGGIGSIKHNKYGFNRPAARSVKMMGACGQLAVLGFNLNKVVRELAKRRDAALVG